MNIGNSQNSNSFTTQSSASDGANTLIPMASIKTEEGVNYFQGHIWNNKAPIFIGQESEEKSKKSVMGKTNVFTYFNAAKVPVSYRNDLREQAVEYKGLSDDDRAAYIEARVVTKACTDKLHPALLNTNGAFAARDLEAWQLLGHYAGRLKTEDQYQQGPEQLGGTRVSVDRYSYYLTKRLFLSGFRESNAMSLINANTTHKALRALNSEDKTAIEAAKAEDAEKSPAANVVFVEQRDQKRWVILLVTRKDIAKGEQLFVDYGVEYWKHHEYVEDLERRQLFCQYCGLVSPNLDFFATHQKTEHETKNHTTIFIPNLPSRESGRWNPGSETTENVSQCDVSNIVPESSNNPEDSYPINTLVKCSPPLDTEHQEPPVDSNASITLGQDDTDDALLKSQSITSKKNNKSNMCGKEFKYKQKLKFHKFTHTDGIRSLCHICGKVLKRYSIKDHSYIHTGVKPYVCDICQKRFYHRGNLKTHRRIHTDEKPDRCEKTVKKLYECEACGKAFKSAGNLKRHDRIHKGVKPFKCETCDKVFSASSSLRTHNYIHTGHKPYKCDICQKNFTQKSHLQIHMWTHTGEKPHKCEICGKKFTQRGGLISHIKKNHDKKPDRCDQTVNMLYRCETCGKAFEYAGYLKRHIRRHTGERPYKCEMCDSNFSDASALSKHRVIHTGERPHKCDICQKKFTQKGSLKSHMRLHTGEKPHKCDICQKKFTEKSSLKSHMRFHTGEKPFNCEICGQVFSYGNSLKYHKKTKHTSNNRQ